MTNQERDYVISVSAWNSEMNYTSVQLQFEMVGKEGSAPSSATQRDYCNFCY